MKNRTHRAVSLSIALLATAASLMGCTAQEAPAEGSQRAEVVSSHEGHSSTSITLDSGQTIQIPAEVITESSAGKPFIAPDWAYTTFSQNEATQIHAACARERQKLIEQSGDMFANLPRPLNWLCNYSNSPNKFKG